MLLSRVSAETLRRPCFIWEKEKRTAENAFETDEFVVIVELLLFFLLLFGDQIMVLPNFREAGPAKRVAISNFCVSFGTMCRVYCTGSILFSGPRISDGHEKA